MSGKQGVVSTQREVETTYAPDAEADVPDLTTLAGVHEVRTQAPVELSAQYFDTEDLGLLRAGVTLRRRTGGTDEGWHVKVPATGARDEIHHPLGRAGTPPKAVRDVVIGWTENCSIRNNASKSIVAGVEQLTELFPFDMVIFDSDCGSEFINHEVAAWLQARDIEQTRSRPYQKNDQAHVESKNNHVVRKHAFYWRYDTQQELELLNRLWRLVSLRLNFFTPTKKAVGYTTTADGRKKRIYDKPATPWQRLQASDVLDAQHLSVVAARVDGINPADLTRQINAIQMQLLDLAKAKTEALAAARHVDLAALQPSINRLAKTK